MFFIQIPTVRRFINFAAEKDSCIILEKTVWEDPNKRGCIKVNGKTFCLPLLLVKLFKDGFGEFPLTNLTVFSRPDCALSRYTN